MKWNKNTFRDKMQEIHPDYIFENTYFVKSSEKVKYFCKAHGQQEAYPRHLLNGSICRGCNKGSPPKLTPTQLKDRCYKIHGDTYDYSCTTFDVQNIENEKVNIICKKHGVFEQSLHSHLTGRGCNKCANEIRKKKASENPTGWSYTNWQKAGERSKNFDSFKVYIIHCWNDNEEFYKVGKTFKTIEKRFKDKIAMPYSYNIILTIESNDCRLISKIEVLFKKYLIKRKPLIKFNGFSECGVFRDEIFSTCTCGVKNENLKLSDRVWTCNSCGTENSRDHLASQNILKEGRKSLGELALAKSEA